MEEITLGRVDVLPLERIVLSKLPRLKAHDPSPEVGEREHQPLREVVASADGGQSGRSQLVGRKALLARLLGEPAPGREPEPELLRDVLAEPARCEVLPDGSSGVAVPEKPLEVRRRLLENGVEALAPPALGLDARRCLLVLERHAKAFGEPLDRADEVEVLRLADEGDDVSPLPAPEAVVELVDRVHGERRRPLLVERAAAREP